jgi:plastocyanin
MAWRRVRAIAPVPTLLGAAVLLVAACGGGDDGGNGGNGGAAPERTITIEGAPANDHGTKEVSGTAEVEMGDNYFEPTILVGAPGSKIKLNLVNNGDLEHNIAADLPQVEAAFQLDQDVRSGGGTATVEVTFPESGDQLFFCKYHEGDGMVGVFRAKP